MSARAENAIQQLYEDPGLRDELSDDEVPTMLQWAEGAVAKLDARSADDAAFDAGFDALRKLLTSINRYIGRRAYSTPDEQVVEMDRIAERAGMLGYSMPFEQASTLFQAQGAEDNITALAALLAKIDGSAAESGATTALSTPATESPVVGTTPGIQRIHVAPTQSPSEPGSTGETEDTDVNITGAASDYDDASSGEFI
jgi:hypothetical protein